jgi:hypothetical protein
MNAKMTDESLDAWILKEEASLDVAPPIYR